MSIKSQIFLFRKIKTLTIISSNIIISIKIKMNHFRITFNIKNKQMLLIKIHILIFGGLIEQNINFLELMEKIMDRKINSKERKLLK